MIMNTKHVEEVNGIVVGHYSIAGQLTYQGRNQGKCFYAETEDELKALAVSKLDEIEQGCGAAFPDIYPVQPNGWKGWMLKIIE